MEKIGIYIHIPFCRRSCFYCHFVKMEYNSALVEEYTGGLVNEVNELGFRSNSGYKIDSIYIGGGSPSLLKESQVAALLDAVYAAWEVDPDVECTLEMNPEDVSADKLRFLSRLGINRLSIGTQSFIQEDLDYLKRTHRVEDSIKAVKDALDTGFTNINVDFIIGLPSQTREKIVENLSFLRTVTVPHISTYLLETGSSEENPVSESISSIYSQEGVDNDCRDVIDHELYFITEEFLQDLGYVHYEVSNYSKPGYRSRHNLKYWENKSYIGAGLSASGYEKGLDYKNTGNLEEYMAAVRRKRLPRIEMEQLDPVLRKIVMGLRLLKGIPASCFNHHPDRLNLLLEGNFLISRSGYIRVNPRKILLLNEILTHFFDPV